jgi:DNA polymerase-1
MGGAYPLKAPLDVNVGVGKSWDEAAHWLRVIVGY